MGDREGILDLENTANVMMHEAVSIGKSIEREVEHAAQSATSESSNKDVSEEAVKETERIAKQSAKTAEHITKAFGHDISNWGKELSKSWEPDY